MARLNFFYDAQIKSYLKQIVAAFSSFQYESFSRDGSQILKTVPVRWGDASVMASHIIKLNTENMVNSAPFMSLYVTSLDYSAARRQDPSFVDNVQVSERYYDEEAQAYTTSLGNKYSVHRFMPVPYDLNVKLDIWTTNTEQKLQLFEQISILFNPSINFQSNDNPLDWTSLTYLELKETTWSSRSIPAGSETALNVMSLTFMSPIWINPPAKVKRQAVIHQIITNVIDSRTDDKFGEGNGVIYTNSDLLSRVIVTPNNHQIKVEGNTITLLSSSGNETNDNNVIFSWKELLDLYGNFKEANPDSGIQPGTTQLRLKKYASDLDDDSKDIVGVLEYHPTEANKLIWTIDEDTLPQNTMEPINAIIDPHVSFPGNKLPAAVAGQRYLIINDIGSQTIAWGSLVANENDIIEYNGSEWIVVFDASATQEEQFVNNAYTGKQLNWDGSSWILSIDGDYKPGYWRLFI